MSAKYGIGEMVKVVSEDRYRRDIVGAMGRIVAISERPVGVFAYVQRYTVILENPQFSSPVLTRFPEDCLEPARVLSAVA